MDRLIDSFHQLKVEVEVDINFYPPKHTVINIEKVVQFKPVFPPIH